VRIGGRRPTLFPEADLVRSLAQLLAETGLSEIEYAVGDRRIRVARNGAAPLGNGGDGYSLPVPGAPQMAERGAEPASPDLSRLPGAVNSPMVGTAYLAPEPGAPPFVRIGDAVSEGQPLLIIEAMKVMNQIRAPRPGCVRRVLVADGAPVEYGAPLMVIE
jgi:acetyl-CoA carboxylase biotin carboxyl carrier protein